MKRSAALLALVVLPVLGFIPTAHALGAGICTISGTIRFSTSPQIPTQGTWHIETGVIECRGLFNRVERILGPGSFSGSGFYGTMAPNHGGACLHQVGSGTVDYRIPTSEQDVHLIEPQTFVLAGAGSFTTPTLKGTFQVSPPYDGEGVCLTKPLSRAVFLAEAAMVRHPGIFWDGSESRIRRRWPSRWPGVAPSEL